MATKVWTRYYVGTALLCALSVGIQNEALAPKLPLENRSTEDFRLLSDSVNNTTGGDVPQYVTNAEDATTDRYLIQDHTKGKGGLTDPNASIGERASNVGGILRDKDLNTSLWAQASELSQDVQVDGEGTSINTTTLKDRLKNVGEKLGQDPTEALNESLWSQTNEVQSTLGPIAGQVNDTVLERTKRTKLLLDPSGFVADIGAALTSIGTVLNVDPNTNTDLKAQVDSVDSKIGDFTTTTGVDGKLATAITLLDNGATGNLKLGFDSVGGVLKAAPTGGDDLKAQADAIDAKVGAFAKTTTTGVDGKLITANNLLDGGTAGDLKAGMDAVGDLLNIHPTATEPLYKQADDVRKQVHGNPTVPLKTLVSNLGDLVRGGDAFLDANTGANITDDATVAKTRVGAFENFVSADADTAPADGVYTWQGTWPVPNYPWPDTASTPPSQGTPWPFHNLATGEEITSIYVNISKAIMLIDDKLRNGGTYPQGVDYVANPIPKSLEGLFDKIT